MSEPLYSLTIAVGALKNVPGQGHDVAERNGHLLAATDADIIIDTETWNQAVKDGLAEAFDGKYHVFTSRGQSVLLAYNAANRFKVIKEGRIRGGASPRIPGLCDRRDVPYLLLSGIDGRRFWVLGIHTAPIKPKDGRIRVAAAKTAHAAARRRLRAFVKRTGYPVLMAGDWNARHLTSGRVIGDHIGNGIVHAEVFDGANARWGQAKVSSFKLHSDHPGVLIEVPVLGVGG